ncbi:hypothetical protein MNBD_ALPHA03-2086 [hydrothermal vent metagenome]|uniref:PepSY domain-containing protein n=1 Tax=hydrothermal vent metagenome TaxID=652676 RepID=A0A3B1B5F4_9ZZZZ
MKKLLILATSAAVLTIASPAFASSSNIQCGDSSGQWMPDEVAKSKATELGYDVRRIKREDGCLEIYAFDKNGNMVELFMNPVSGEVVQIKNKS